MSAVDIGCFLHTAGRENFNAHLRDELLNGEIFYTLRRVASCATLTDSAGHAGATENLTFHLDHSAGAISLGHGSGEATVTDILTNDEISLLRSLEKKSRTITGNFTHKRYDRLETKGYIKRSSQSPSMQDILYEITDAGKAALRAVGGAAE